MGSQLELRPEDPADLTPPCTECTKELACGDAVSSSPPGQTRQSPPDERRSESQLLLQDDSVEDIPLGSIHLAVLSRQFDISRITVGGSQAYLVQTRLHVPRKALRGEYGCFDSDSMCAQLLKLKAPSQSVRLQENTIYKTHMRHLNTLECGGRSGSLASVRIADNPAKAPVYLKRPPTGKLVDCHSEHSPPARKRGRPRLHCLK